MRFPDRAFFGGGAGRFFAASTLAVAQKLRLRQSCAEDLRRMVSLLIRPMSLLQMAAMRQRLALTEADLDEIHRLANFTFFFAFA